MRPEDDVPRRYGRTRAQTRGLEQGNSSMVRDNAFEVMWKPPVMVGRVENSGDGRAERDLDDGMQACYALLAEEQSNVQPDGPNGKYWSFFKDEPQSYCDACGSVNREIRLGAMQQEFQGLMDNNTFDLAGLPAGRRPISATQNTEERCSQPYREAVGGLMRIANATRPDISNAVREVVRQAHDPGERHWQAVLRIIEYLRGTRDKGIAYKRSSSAS